MELLLLSYLAGMLTILSPCILPVLPFIFARSDTPFRRGTLPMLLGMALTFAAVASLAAAGGAWAGQANQYGRWFALALMAVFGIGLLLPSLADRALHPLARLGGSLTEKLQGRESPMTSLGLGVATGLLWAPCAGPILGIVLTGAALQGASARSATLLLAYGVGAATSLAVAGFAGGSVMRVARRSLGVGVWIRRVLGVAVLAGVALIAFGFDSTILTVVGNGLQARLEQRLIDRLGGGTPSAAAPVAAGARQAPLIDGAVAWLNSKPLTLADLRGHVVLIDFWTYSCINCLRTLPYIQGWADRYGKDGLVIIGVHTPEFAFEKDVGNVRDAVARLHLTYPVAVDSNYKIWQSYNNQYWPAHYLIDANGLLRDEHFGEGAYDETEHQIRDLLAEAGHKTGPSTLVAISQIGDGAEKAADAADLNSPETYLGYERAQNFVSPGGAAHDLPHDYACPVGLRLNQWCLTGNWIVQNEKVIAAGAGSVRFRFHARDLHMVLGPKSPAGPARLRVLLDGKPPAGDHGADTTPDGMGQVDSDRLYQLIRQQNTVGDHTIEIQFPDPGTRAFTFTFG